MSPDTKSAWPGVFGPPYVEDLLKVTKEERLPVWFQLQVHRLEFENINTLELAWKKRMIALTGTKLGHLKKRLKFREGLEVLRLENEWINGVTKVKSITVHEPNLKSRVDHPGWKLAFLSLEYTSIPYYLGWIKAEEILQMAMDFDRTKESGLTLSELRQEISQTR